MNSNYLYQLIKHKIKRGAALITQEVGAVKAVAEPPRRRRVREVDSVVREVGLGGVPAGEVVVVADVDRRVAEHVHRRRLRLRLRPALAARGRNEAYGGDRSCKKKRCRRSRRRHG